MTRQQRLLFGYGLLGLVAAGAASALVLRSDHESQRAATLALGELAGLSFVAAGILGAWRRPENGTGTLLVWVGFTFFAGALAEANSPVPFTIGVALESLFIGAFVHLLLAYPEGALATRLERGLVVGGYAASLVFPIAFLLVQPNGGPMCTGCPTNSILVRDSPHAAHLISIALSAIGGGLLLAALVVLIRRWRAASVAYRRSFRYVFASGGLTLGLFVVGVALDPVDSHTLSIGLSIATACTFVLVPFAFVAGLLRGRFAGASVGRLVAALGPSPGPGQLREVLRDVLGDPTLELGYWLPETHAYVDLEGRRFDPDAHAAATVVDGEAGRIGVLAHDPALLGEPALGAVVGAARLALENDRLHAELRAHLVELEGERDFTRLVVDTAPAYFCVVDAEGRIVRFNRTLEQMTGVDDDATVRGRFFWDVFAVPDDHDAVRASLALAAVAGRTEPHEETLVARDGARRVVQWSETVIPDQLGQLRLIVLSGLDVTERRAHERELQRLADEQAALGRVATLVATGPTEETLLATVTSEVANLFGAHAAHLWRYEGDGARVVGGWNVPAAVDTFHVPDPETLVGRVRATSAPARRDDYTRAGGVVGELVRATGIKSAVGAPISVEGTAWGAIVISKRGDEVFPPGTEHRLGGFAALVAQAVANAEAREQLRASRQRLVEAGDAERRRLERNLHDGAQQRLVAISISMRLAHAKLERAPDDARALLSAASEELGNALNELRELARGIHPAILTDRGLAPALEALAGRSPLPVSVAYEVDERLPPPVEAAAYYVVSESLANVAKYAQAQEVGVRVSRANGVARVEVRDDGIGGADASRGSGLRGLADRVEALDGRLEVESPPAAGTRVWAEIPVL